jgi:APA family basic amino acid/polyamine antiporter
VTDPAPEGLARGVRLRSATALVVASMIGAGIFTSTGFQAHDLGHPGWILLLWAVGGVLAWCGALCFAELGAMMPQPGAEYVYIRETYGKSIAFMSAFVALVAGFSAPIAVALKSFVRYLGHFVPIFVDDPLVAGIVPINDLVAIVLVWILVLIHARGLRAGLGFTDLVTALKVVGILALILGAVVSRAGDSTRLLAIAPQYEALSMPDLFGALATSLIFVNFCYLGWNGAAYMAGEMDQPQRDLPRALLLGTALVTALYLALNAVYFYAAGVEGLAGVVEVGLVTARALFGAAGVGLVTALLCVSILASASAMTVVGPRVYYAFGNDAPLFAALARVSPRTRAPIVALITQGAVTSLIILSGRVDQILSYAGFTLTLFASLAVSCVIVLRVTRPNAPRPFRAWGYPVTPLIFLTVSAWTLVWAYTDRPEESRLGLATAALGGALCAALTRRRTPLR